MSAPAEQSQDETFEAEAHARELSEDDLERAAGGGTSDVTTGHYTDSLPAIYRPSPDDPVERPAPIQPPLPLEDIKQAE